MTVWIDSDSCPAAVRDIVAETVSDQYGKSRDVTAVFIANRTIPVSDKDGVSFHLTSQDKESADDYIVENARTGDLVLTKDFLLAKRTLEAGMVTMNFDGRVFEGEWLKKRIEERNIMEVLYNSGSLRPYRKKSRSDAKNRDFDLSFSREMNKILQKGE